MRALDLIAGCCCCGHGGTHRVQEAKPPTQLHMLSSLLSPSLPNHTHLIPFILTEALFLCAFELKEGNQTRGEHDLPEITDPALPMP